VSFVRFILSAFGGTLILGGLLILTKTLGWLPAMGVFVMIWGNNVAFNLPRDEE
jgi:hypothetical protein